METDIEELNVSGGDEELDGALVNIDVNAEILTPNKNIYFIGFALMALGFALAGYGLYKYFNISDTRFIKTEHATAYTLIGFGSPFIISGLILVLKAVKYLLVLKPFLKKAKFTKCNVFFIIEEEQRSRSRDGIIASRKFHTLKVDYIDYNGNYREKTIKWLIAFDLFRKLQARYNFDDIHGQLAYYSFKNSCLAAYNDSGKLIVVYNWQELK